MDSMRLRKLRRGKIRGSAAEPAVRACLETGGTLQEAAEVYEFMSGAKVSLDAVSRFNRPLLQEAKAFDEVARTAAVLREPEDYPGCHVAVMARKLLMLRALNAVQQLPDDAFEEMPADKLSLVIARLERSGALTDRNRFDANDQFELAGEVVHENTLEKLRGHPDLARPIRLIFEELGRREAGNPGRWVRLQVEEKKPEEDSNSPRAGAVPAPPSAPDAGAEDAAPAAPLAGAAPPDPSQGGDEGAAPPEGDGQRPSARAGEEGG